MESAGDPAERFGALIAGPPEALDLDVACALLAATFTGRDRCAEVVETLDVLAAECDEPTITGVLDVMRPRMRGNDEDYYDPRNSYLDSVLERGLGLPITLSVVAIEIGRRVGAAIVGVGLPAHFMVRELASDLFGDPFNGGVVHDRAGIVAVWERLVGPGTPFDPLHLEPVGPRTILIRMLNNLRAVAVQRGDSRSLYALARLRGAFVELANESEQHARWMRAWN